jgi:CDP-glucose 4,6-dehydratase
VRPWQHVLEPLSGYLTLAARLLRPDGAQYATSWNFGPEAAGDATVLDVAERTARLWGDDARVQVASGDANPHETAVLRLDSARARSLLGWRPRWALDEALQRTVEWHRRWRAGDDMRAVTLAQIAAYEAVGAA